MAHEVTYNCYVHLYMWYIVLPAWTGELVILQDVHNIILCGGSDGRIMFYENNFVCII